MDDLAVMDDLDLVRESRAQLRLTCLRGEKIVLGDGDSPATLMTEGYFLMLTRAQRDALRHCAARGEPVLIETADGSRREISAYRRRPS
jgi:hypothetical protein